ncbi:MAG: S1 family peptidase [Pseudobdellovibrionaceae bacterium]|nr:S1 family peptidase [Pseudobdellovibrionaceae bacterium]
MLLLPLSCSEKKIGASSVKVLNGTEVPPGGYPEVHILNRTFSDKICTGTFISHNTFVTANHCVDLQDHQLSDHNVNGVQPVAGFKHPLPSLGRRYDLAVLVFPPQPSTVSARLINRPAVVGDILTIVGFGVNQSSADVGIKRQGTNTIENVADGLITFEGIAHPQTAPDGSIISTGEDVSARGGDSGGPLYIEGMLAGVTSGGRGNLSYYVDLNSAHSHYVLQKAVDLGAEIPGFQPQGPTRETITEAGTDVRRQVAGVWKREGCRESSTLERRLDLDAGLITDTFLSFARSDCQGAEIREPGTTKQILKLSIYRKADGTETLVLSEKHGTFFVEEEFIVDQNGSLVFLQKNNIFVRRP